MATHPDLRVDAMKPLRRPDGRSFLGGATLRRARAIAEALFATADGPPPRDRVDWLVLELEDFLARIGTARTTFVLGLFALAALGAIFAKSFTFTGLPLEERIDALARLEAGRLAFAVLGVKILLSALYFEHPDAAREIGHDGKCMGPT